MPGTPGTFQAGKPLAASQLNSEFATKQDYPIPVSDVPGVNGVTISGTPSAGQVPTATGPASATWQQSSSGLVNINTLSNAPFVTDGVTSNVPMFQSLAPALQGVGPEMPVPVNITVGTPTVLSINPTVPSGGTQPNPVIHFLKPNQAFHFTISAGGSLPSGISLGTTYYITAANMTGTTFTFSTVNNYSSSIGEGSTVNTTGSLTGTLSIVLTGRDVDLFIPPGPYFGGNYGSPAANVNVTPNGMSRIRYFAYGAMFDTKTSFGVIGSPVACMQAAKTWSLTGLSDYVDTTPNELVVPGLDAQVTLITTGNAANYYVGQWVSVFGLDIQDPYGHLASGPPNYQYQEFKRIKSINTGTGILTLDGPLKWVYLSTFPNLFTPGTGQVGGGKAMVVQMHPAWDTEVEIRGARWVGQSTASCARIFKYIDCVFQGYANDSAQAAPSVAQSYVYHNCRFGPSGAPGATYMEVDKMLEYLELNGCVSFNEYAVLFSSPSLQVCNIKNHQGSSITGTPRQIRITDSSVHKLMVGPYIGVSDSVQVHNTRLEYFDMLNRNDDNTSIVPGNDMTLVPNWSFSGGTFTRNISALPGGQGMTWQIPGAKLYMTDAGNIFKYYQNMGAPLTILNVYMDGSGNFSFDTTLSAVPTRQTSGAVAISNASPAVVSGMALTAGTPVVFPSGSTLPAPFAISTVYYVAASPAPSGSNCSLAATVGGSAINSTASGSGITMFANPLCFRPHPCARFTGSGNTGCTTIVDQNGSVDAPLFSQVRRVFVGKQSNLGGGTGSSDYQQPLPKIWGGLTRMVVNVLKAGSSGTLNISCPGFTQPNLGLSNFSQTIDVTVAGVRTVTNAAVTGSAGGDSIAPYADWVAGPLVFTWASPPSSLANSPIVTFEMFTDQGVTRFSNMMGAPGTPASGSNLWQYTDSGIIEQYGSLP